MKLCVLLMCMAASAAVAQAPPPQREARPPAIQNQQEEALSNDVARMRALLHQMEMNLALVSNMQDPLKHQFQLEIDMWRVVLDGMERRLQAARGNRTGGVVSPGTVPLRQDSRQGKP